MIVDELATGEVATGGRPGEQLPGETATEEKDLEASLICGAGGKDEVQERVHGLREHDPEMEGQAQAPMLPRRTSEV